MKILFLFFAFLLMAFSVKAQELTDAQKQYLSSVNLLKNPGFESGKASWTLASGTSAVETSNVKQGKQSLKLTLSAQALNFKQTSTLNATAFADGVNGSISISVKTTLDNIYLCRTDSTGAVVASTDSAKITNCLKISNNGKWGDYPLGIILGATQNGLALVSLTPSTAAAVNVTGDVFVDSGILEAGLKTQVVNNIGPWTNGTCTSSWTTNTTTTCRFRQIGESYEYQMEATLGAGGGPNAATLSYNLPSGHVIDTAKFHGGLVSTYPSIPESVLSIRDTGVSTYTGTVTYNSTTSVIASYLNSSAAYVTPSSVTNALPITFGALDMVAVSFTVPIVGLSGSSSVLTVPSDSFSTDTNTLAHKTTAIVAADPIGTYNTYSYAINTNTKTICGTAPSTLPTSANGFLIFTRAYNAPSTCGNPARVEIKIGAAGGTFPILSREIYKNTGKIISGVLDPLVYTSAIDFGAKINSYDSSTGILTVDTGVAWNVTTTTHVISFSDNLDATSGYLVVNAQKAKDSIIGSFAEVVTSIGTTSPDIQSVYFASGAACTTGTCIINSQVGNKITSVTWSSTGTYNINGIDGLNKYHCTGSSGGGAYKPLVHFKSSSSTTHAGVVSGSGVTLSNADGVSVICIGIP